MTVLTNTIPKILRSYISDQNYWKYSSEITISNNFFKKPQDDIKWDIWPLIGKIQLVVILLWYSRHQIFTQIYLPISQKQKNPLLLYKNLFGIENVRNCGHLYRVHLLLKKPFCSGLVTIFTVRISDHMWCEPKSRPLVGWVGGVYLPDHMWFRISASGPVGEVYLPDYHVSQNLGLWSGDRSLPTYLSTVTIFNGSGSDFWKVMVPVSIFEKLRFRFRFRFRFQLHI